MIALHLAEGLRPYIGRPLPPNDVLVQRFRRACDYISNLFTVEIPEKDQRYLYIRFKLLKHQTGFLEILTNPLLALAFIRLYGYTDSDLMDQYVQKVESLNIGFKSDVEFYNKKSRGFAKGPSRMVSGDSHEDSHESLRSLSGSRSLLSVLIDCIHENDLGRFKEIITEDPDVLHRMSNGLYPIHHAADLGREEMINIILNEGADVNERDDHGQTALHYAASNGYPEVVEYLLRNGADRDLEDQTGCTAAQLSMDASVVELLSST